MVKKKSALQNCQYLFKIIIVGECETGKTAIKTQICEKQCFATYKPTIGVEDGIYQGETDHGSFKVILYDTSGQERFQPMSKAHLSSSQAAFFVYDLKNLSSLEKLEARIKEIEEGKNGKDLLKVLIGNKNDLLDTSGNDITKEKANQIAHQYNMKKFELSARVRPSLMKALNETINELISLHLMKMSSSFEASAVLNTESDKRGEISTKPTRAVESIQLETVSPSLLKNRSNLDTNGIEIISKENKQHKKRRKRANKKLCVSGFLFEKEKEPEDLMAKKKMCCSIF